MPIARFQMPDGRIARFEVPAGLTPEQATALIEQELSGAPESKPTDRTMGEAATDIYAGLKSGVGSLLQLPSQIAGVVGGEYEKPGEETGLSAAGKELQAEAQALKSPGLKAREAARAAKVSEAEQKGQIDAFMTAFSETVRDPGLLTNFLAEQAPQMIPALKAAKIGTALAGTRAGVGAAIGTGAIQQGADIAAGTYQELYDELIKKGATDTEAAGAALGYARATGAGAAVISLLAQRLPGARAIEEAFAGKPGSLGRVLGGARAGVGEAIGETAEETPAKLLQNLALQQVAPETSLTRGLGETAALAAIGGGGMGVGAGLLQRQARREEAPPEPKQPPSQFAPTTEPEPEIPPSGMLPERPDLEKLPDGVKKTTEGPTFAPPPEEVVGAMQNYWEGKPEDFGMSFADIQNRDRSKPASIQQMTSIAAEPDYNRLSVSRDFGAGAPVVISDIQIDPKYMGRIDMVSASDGTKIPVQYAVVDAKQLTPSNMADGSTVPAYADPAFQGIRPVAGNGRVAGLQRSYAEGTNQDYTQSLINDPAHGINAEAIKELDEPVLVRIMPKSSLTPDIADKSNVGGQLGMSPTEQAKIDMGRFDLQGIEFLADGSPSLRSLRQFIAAMPQEEQAQLMNKQGQPNPLAKIRLANALFARAYENDGLIDLYAEAMDPEAQQILRGMAIAAPAMSNLSGAGEYDIRQFIVKAAELAVNARRQGVDLAKYAEQGDIEMDPLTQEVVGMFAANKNAPRRIGDALTSLAAEAQQAYEQTQGGPDLFGNEPVGKPLDQIFQGLRGEPAIQAPVVEEKPEPEAKPERVEFVIDKDPAVIAKEIKGMSVPKLSQWLIDNAPNSAAKAIAEKITERIKEFDQRGVPMGMKVMNGSNRSSTALGKSRMSWGPQGVQFTVFINGVDSKGNVDSKTGSTYETIMHELLHVCTQTQLVLSPKSAAEVKELERIRKVVNDQIKADIAAGKDHPWIATVKNIKANRPKSWQNFGPMGDINETLAWGLTDPDFQSYLAQIQVSPQQTAFTKFVEVLRNLLGLDPKYQTALEQLAAISEEILSESAANIGVTAEKAGTYLGTRVGTQTGIAPSEGVVESEMEMPEFIRKGAEKLKKATKEGGISPEQGFGHVDPEFLKKLGPIFAPEGKTFAQKMDKYRDRTFQRIAQGIADQYRTIKDYSPLAYMKARLSKTIDGALEGLTFNGEVKLTDGALDIKPDTKGLIDTLKPVGDEVNSFLIWLALNRDAALVERGRLSSIAPEIVKERNKLAAGKLNGKNRIDVYESVRRDLNKLNKSVLNVALEKGLIDRQAYDTFLKDVYYIPFYKMVEEGEVADIRTSAGLANKYFSKQLKGGEKPFGDLMENLLRNWSHILSSSMKNDAAVETVKAATEMGAAYPNLRPKYEWRDGKVYLNGEPIAATEIDGVKYGEGELRPGIYSSEGKGLVKVMINGFPAYFDISKDPLLIESIMSIGYMGPKSKFLDIARDFKNILQFGVTVSPAFKVRNLIRDSVQAAAVSKLGLNIAKNVTQGLSASDKNNPDHISALAGGGIFNFGSAYEGDQAKLIKRLLEAGVNGDDILNTEAKIKSGLAKAWRAYQDWGNKSEAANRMALYKQLREKGYSHLEASYYARDLLDFSMQGAWPAFRMVTQVVPFLNARVQGLYKLGRDGIMPTSRVIYNTVTGTPIDIDDKQKAQQFSVVTGAVVLASLMLYMAYKDDDEWKKREQWDRDNFWWFKLPGMDAAIRIPKPFEIGAFGTLAERVAEQMFDEGAEGRVFEQSMKRMLTDTFAINPIPQMIKPLVDLYANKDSFTGAPIETAGMERLSKAERVATNTSPLAKALSQVTNVFLPEATEVSPVQVDYAIKAYLGWMGATISASSHYAVMPFSKGAYPDHNWTETVSMGFVKSLPATQSGYVTSFYENMKIIEQAYADMRHYAEIGESEKVQKILEEKGDKIALAKFYDKTSKDMAKLRKVTQLIQADEDMSGAQKKEEIDRIKLLIGELAKQAEDVRKSFRK